MFLCSWLADLCFFVPDFCVWLPGTPGAGHSAADARQQEMMMFSSLKQNKSFKIFEGCGDCADDDEVYVCVCVCVCVSP